MMLHLHEQVLLSFAYTTGYTTAATQIVSGALNDRSGKRQ